MRACVRACICQTANNLCAKLFNRKWCACVNYASFSSACISDDVNKTYMNKYFEFKY